MLSRTWVIGVPPSTQFSVVAMSSEVTPSWRALSWRTSTLTTRAGSIQSNTTLPRSGLLADDAGELLREIPDLRDVGPAHAVLHGTSDRRADLEQLDVGIGAGKRLPQIGLELRLDAVARLNAALGHDDIWPNQAFAVCTSNDSTNRGAPVPT